MSELLKHLYQKLSYEFQDDVLIRTALTHRSYGQPNNERLEFLGDAVLNMLIAEVLFERNPTLQEGELSRVRANYVKGEALAKLAQNFDLGRYLFLGSGELKSGGRQRHSILADALEAVVGALFLEAGFEKCREIVLSWFVKDLAKLDVTLASKDAKTQLQEYLQARQCALPNYTIIQTTGDAHRQWFVVQCQLLDLNCDAQGEGSSRRKAEQMAAAQCLRLLQQDQSDD